MRRARVNAKRRVRIFKIGRTQAVEIPSDFELSSEKAIMRKVDNRLIVEPASRKSLLAVLATLDPLEEDFPSIPDLPLKRGI